MILGPGRSLHLPTCTAEPPSQAQGPGSARSESLNERGTDLSVEGGILARKPTWALCSCLKAKSACACIVSVCVCVCVQVPQVRMPTCASPAPADLKDTPNLLVAGPSVPMSVRRSALSCPQNRSDQCSWTREASRNAVS